MKNPVLSKSLTLGVIVAIGVAILGPVLWGGKSRPDLEFVEWPGVPGFRTLVQEEEGLSKSALSAVMLAAIPEGDIRATAKGELSGEDLCNALYAQDGDPSTGPDDAPVSIVEFFDYQCPFCRTASTMLHDLQLRHPRIRIVYKEWPIFGARSLFAARAALAADKQGKYAALHRKLMSLRAIPTEELIHHVALDLEIDAGRLIADTNNEIVSMALVRNDQLARKLGLVGTPSFIIGRTVVEGKVTSEQLEALVTMAVDGDMGAPCGSAVPATGG